MSRSGLPEMLKPLPGAPHFTLAELTRSDTALAYGLDNTPCPAALEGLRRLARLVLEPLRRRFGPIRVTSGYRSSEVNWFVSLNRTSRHCQGVAADVRPLALGADSPSLARWATANLPCGQIILYNYGNGWVHLDLARADSCSPRLYLSRAAGSLVQISADDLSSMIADGYLTRDRLDETC
ncbi:hypothetical protein FAK_22480 [Desulfoferula mesophila]|uniref:Peptidase M15A C-terminal domain-containing protein n=2 Tax=Desulfoferula mesophila TaxID=3058419 RepID=A0AAU9F1E7_9BACT|nr:hypothetical protein FAK_22480 [Desulfoferula mesophilus]